MNKGKQTKKNRSTNIMKKEEEKKYSLMMIHCSIEKFCNECTAHSKSIECNCIINVNPCHKWLKLEFRFYMFFVVDDT